VSPKLKRAIELFTRLPGVGDKTALRYVMHMLTTDPRAAADLGACLSSLHRQFRPCRDCGNIAEAEDKSPDDVTTNDDASAPHTEPRTEPLCAICRDPRRDPALLCVVGKAQDVLALERPQSFRGRYFVLGRLLSPLEGIGPDKLPLPRLLARIERDHVREGILATPPSVDGEATALFLRRELSGVSVSRIASGIPHGGDLEYADPITLGRALDGRKTL
jgi:recombination protein RecR